MRTTLKVVAPLLVAMSCAWIRGEERLAAQRSLQWLKIGDGYKMLAPIPNGDNILVVKKDDTICRKGYGVHGVVEITKASGPVSHIVSTQGNVQIGFEFVYATNDGNMLFGYDGRNKYPINTNEIKGSVTALCYASDHGLFCGTSEGRVHQYVNNPNEQSVGSPGHGWNWRDLGDLPGRGPIKEIAHTGNYLTAIKYNRENTTAMYSGDFLFRRCFDAERGEYNWDRSMPKYRSSEFITTKKVNAFAAPCGAYGFTILAYETYGGDRPDSEPTYFYKFYRFGPDFDIDRHEDLPLLSNQLSGRGMASFLASSDLFYANNRLWLLSEHNEVSPFIQSYDFAKREIAHYDGKLRRGCYVDTLGTLYGINEAGELLRSEPMPNNLSVDVKYVSPAAFKGDNHKNDAVYRITITGAGLSRDQIFKEHEKYGNNGFKYKISGGGGYVKYAYPLVGVRYIDTPRGNQAGMAALNPRTISFLWLGPKEGEVTVEQTMNGEKHGHPITLPLPPAKPIEFPRKVNVKITAKNDLVAADNGTCAIPFCVELTGDGSEPLPDTSELYNRLVFYKSEGATGVNVHELIGADPLTDDVAILPSDCVEIDGFVKYGSIDPYRNKTGRGRHFYLFLKGELEQKLWVGLVNDDESDRTPLKGTSFSRTPSTAKLSFSGIKLDSSSALEDFQLTENGHVACSNIAQPTDRNGAYHGYLDFILRDQGIFYLFPQGLGSQALDDRLNPAKLAPGFFCAPLGQDKHDNPFWADKYRIGTYTAMVNWTKDKNLTLIAFDRYGRVLNEKMQSAKEHKFDLNEISSFATNGTPLPVIFGSKMKPLSGKGYSGIPEWPAGLFMPPNMKEYITYYTDAPRIVDADYEHTRIRVDFQVNTVLKKNYTLADCAFMEIWEEPKMEAQCLWRSGNVEFRDYASVVLGVKTQSATWKYVRLLNIIFAFLPNREVGRFNKYSFLAQDNFHAYIKDIDATEPTVISEGYEFKTFQDQKYRLKRVNNYTTIGEVNEKPTIFVSPDVKDARR